MFIGQVVNKAGFPLFMHTKPHTSSEFSIQTWACDQLLCIEEARG
jgi:hypothetical protein